jgi:hypothetical protein
VLEPAAHLQRLVPGAVVVGGTAPILYANHRESRDHGHVVADLAERFEMVLEAIEKDEGWVTNRSVSIEETLRIEAFLTGLPRSSSANSLTPNPRIGPSSIKRPGLRMVARGDPDRT